MPLGSDASANISELTKAKAGEKDWPRARIIAAGLNAARERGADIPEHRKKKQRQQVEALKG